MSDTIAIIPAAGLGTRFLPFTRVVSKELLPILNKPALHYIIEELVLAGITRIVIVTRGGKEDLQRYCSACGEASSQVTREWRQLIDMVSITWVNQSAPKGLGHAILSAEREVGDAWTLIALPDVIMDCNVSCSRQLMDAHVMTERALLATHPEKRHPLSNYGVLDVAGTRGTQIKLKGLVEKPRPEDAPSNWVVSGRYLLPPLIFPTLHAIPAGSLGEIQLTDALNVLVKEEALDGFAFNGTTLDIGNVAGWLSANFHFAQKEPAYAEVLASEINEKEAPFS